MPKTFTVMVVYNTMQAKCIKIPMEYLHDFFLHMCEYEKVFIMYFAFLIYSEHSRAASTQNLKLLNF